MGGWGVCLEEPGWATWSTQHIKNKSKNPYKQSWNYKLDTCAWILNKAPHATWSWNLNVREKMAGRLKLKVRIVPSCEGPEF